MAWEDPPPSPVQSSVRLTNGLTTLIQSTVVIVVLSHVITVVPDARMSLAQVRLMLYGVICVSEAFKLLLARHEFAHPTAWIHKSPIPAYILLAMEVGVVAAYVF